MPVQLAEQGSPLTAIDGEGRLVLEFPIEVEVRILSDCDPDEHTELTLTRLLHALEGLL